jgi:hypothetical protein
VKPPSANPNGIRALAFLAALLVFGAAAAQGATYTHVSTPFAWIDPSAHTPVVWSNPTLCVAQGDTIGDDSITAPINIGFTFKYGGSTYTQLNIMTNGRLEFANNYCYAGTATTGPPRTYTLPYPDPNIVNTMKVYGADLRGAGVRRAVHGNAHRNRAQPQVRRDVAGRSGLGFDGELLQSPGRPQ